MEEAPDVLASLVLITAVAALAPLLVGFLHRPRLPEVVLLLGLGMAIGPHGAGLAAAGGPITLLSQLGLAVLFLYAGLEVDPASLVSADGRRAWLAWAVSLSVALLILVVFARGIDTLGHEALAIALTSTALGTLIPILRDAGATGSRLGTLVMTNGAVGEFGPILAMSVLLSARGALAAVLSLLGFGLLAVLVGVAVVRHGPRWRRLVAVVRHGAETSAQTPLRLVVLLLVVMVWLAHLFGLDVILGAFLAGAVVRMLLPADHTAFRARLDGLGFGLLVPVFFVASGMAVDLAVVLEHWWAVLLVFALIVVLRGGPVWVAFGASGRVPRGEALPLAAYSATGLPVIVAVTTVAVDAGALPVQSQSVVVAAGMTTVLVLPALASALAVRRPTAVPPGG